MSGYVFSLGGVEFGLDRRVIVPPDGFDPGSASWRTQDTSEPMGGSVRFGRDYLDGPLWAFNLLTMAGDAVGARGAIAELASVWIDPEAAQVPERVVPLRYTFPGGARVVYGRPRRFAAPPDNRILSGHVPITADFQTADTLHYDETVERVAVNLHSVARGGFSFPAVFPLSVGGAARRTGVVDVGGDATTWARVRIHGPVLNPVVTCDGFTFALVGSIPAGRWVEGSGIPWSRSVVFDDGTPAAALVSRRTRLAHLALHPGRHEVVFTGSDTTSTALAEVLWQKSYRSL